ncbi:uncharacterized protein LOC106378429 [Brassica napus]|nr:uncharacterized protein LOC106378429 [Brassica napus]
MVADILSRESKEWNKAHIDNLFPELASHILSLRPSILGAKDTFTWPLHKTSNYTVKSGYYSTQTAKHQSANLLSTSGTPWNWKKFIWSQDLLPKLKYFLWKAATNSLRTGENLRKRVLVADTACSRCGEPETLDHILFHCDFAKDVWKAGPWIDVVSTGNSSTFKTLIQEARKWTNLPPHGITGNAFPWFVWSIWTARNLWVFEKRKTTPLETSVKAITSQKEWEQAQSNRPKTTTNRDLTPSLQLSLTNESTIFCNTDATWRSDQQAAGLGWIFTDRHTQVLHQGSIGQRNVPSAYMVEALAIREALIQASSYNYTDICLRTDSQELARAITMRRRSTELFRILSDIDSLVFSPSSPFRSCAVAFTPRARNGPADSLAKACLVSFLGLRP